MSKILVLLKPDAVKRGLSEEIIQRMTAAGNHILEARAGIPSRELVEKHYAHLATYGDGVLKRNVDFLCSGPVVMLVVEGSIPELRKLIGATQPILAGKGTIRGDLSTDSIAAAEKEGRGLYNLVHASDSDESAAREIALWRAGFPVAVGEQAIEVLRATNDGNDLSRSHLYLLQEAINRNLTLQGEIFLQLLYAQVAAGAYRKPWLGGVEHVTADHDGSVFWKGIRVEHFTFSVMDSKSIQSGAQAIARGCSHLEKIGVPVTMGTYLNPWLEDVDGTTPDCEKQVLAQFTCPYEHPDGRVAFEVAAPRTENGWPTEARFIEVTGDNISLTTVLLTPGTVGGNAMDAMGFHTARCGANVPFSAKGKDVLAWYARHGITHDKMKRLLEINSRNQKTLCQNSTSKSVG